MIPHIETVTPPAAEPVDAATLKAHLRLNAADTSEDALLPIYIAAARERAEGITHTSFIQRTVRMRLDGFPAKGFILPVWPVVSVTSIVYDDTDGAEQTLASDQYRLVVDKPAAIVPAWGVAWPAARSDFGAVRVTLVAGYGASGTDIPADIRAAVLMIAGDLYEHRAESDHEPDSKTIRRATALLQPYTFWVRE